MSRSFKKIGVIKDRTTINYNKLVRRRNKIRLWMREYLYKDYELVDQYTICDYRFVWDKKWARRLNNEEFDREKRRFFNK